MQLSLGAIMQLFDQSLPFLCINPLPACVYVSVCLCRFAAGYGAAFSGVAPMLAALNSSAPGVTVVNIDSGFGASMAAWRILKNASRIRQAAMGK
jgi:hypothetical protein